MAHYRHRRLLTRRNRLPRFDERAVAHIDLAAIESNCARIRSTLTAGTKLCAVVKADAYGHGDTWCAKAALAGGAEAISPEAIRSAANPPTIQ